MSLSEKVRGTIARYGMLSECEGVAAAVSGGADSVAMLHFLSSLRGETGIRLSAMHLNHKLRGSESERDCAFVKDLCERLGVELFTESADVRAIALERGLSLEVAGRNVRYEFFGRIASLTGFRIATAHSLNDSLETVVFNLARGTDLRGLCGIPAVAGNIIRPLIDCERDEIEAYLKENGMDFVTDSSNASDEFSRNRIRRHVLPALLSVNGGLYKTTAANMEARKNDADFLDALAADALDSLDLGGGRFARDRYMELHKSLRFRVLLSILSKADIPSDASRLERLDCIASSGCGAEQLSPALYFKADKLCFSLESPVHENPAASHFEPVVIPIDGKDVSIGAFSDKKIMLGYCDYEQYEKNSKYDASLLKNSLDCDRIEGNLVLRTRLASDTIKLQNRNCSKNLRKLYSEARIPAKKRGEALVLADGVGVVWVEGFGAAERASPCGGTVKVLTIKTDKGDVLT